MSDLSVAVRRTAGLARFNALLMVRNRLTLVYGIALPLLPLVLLWPARDGDALIAASSSATALLMALLFPVYYNVLSQFVTRRDELVLKRLLSGEARGIELIVAMLLPGLAITLITTVVAAVVVGLLGWTWPINPVLVLLGAVVGAVCFAALAVWTAAWTKTAEAAQLTSAPVLVLGVVGSVRPVLPEDWQRWVDLTPGAAVFNLVQGSWFGLSSDGDSTLSFAQTWGAGGEPLLVLVAWTALAVVLARRSLQWEPRG